MNEKKNLLFEIVRLIWIKMSFNYFNYFHAILKLFVLRENG